MLTLIGVFFAGLAIARAEGGEDDGGGSAQTCQGSGNDQGTSGSGDQGTSTGQNQN